MNPMLKICGITRFEDLREAENAGADCIGIVSVPSSPRYVPPETAAALCRTCRRVKPVLVTANLPEEELNALIRFIKPYAVQLHGGEPPEYARRIIGAEVWKAVHLQTRADVERAAVFPATLLVADAASGGSGRCCDWSLAAELARQRPLLLAGGITPDNAATALKQTGAIGVDVSSGVEDAPGIKSKNKIHQIARSIKR